MTRRSLRSVVIIAAALLTGSGCDEHTIKRLEFGTSVPDARLSIQLEGPVPKSLLYERFSQAAAEGGFVGQGNRTPTAEEFESGDVALSFIWFRATAGNRKEHRLRFGWARGLGDEADAVYFIFYNDDGTDPFEEDDWALFFEWKNEIIPKVFPQARIEITKHPSESTNPEDVARISASLGIEE